MLPHQAALKKEFYGSTTVGAKGQVVIPAAARKGMSLKDGDKLLVFGTGHGMICLAKLSNVEKLIDKFSKNLTSVKGAIKKAKRS